MDHAVRFAMLLNTVIFALASLPYIRGYGLNLDEHGQEAVLNLLTRLQEITRDDLLQVLDEEVETQCQKDFKYFLDHNRTGWAMQMLDANAKVPWGVLEGSFTFMGSFDECVGVQVPYRFDGQHCMADVNISLPLQPGKSFNMPFFYGLCLPSTCSALDLQNYLIHLWNSRNLTIPVHIKVDSNNCRLQSIPNPSDGDWVVVGVFFGFVALGIASTAYDCFQRFKKNNNKPHQLLSAFSFYSNGKFLLSTSKDPNMMTALFGIRTITMGWVVLGHSYLNMMYSPIVNLIALQQMNMDHSKVIIFNSFLSVDTFFLLSGMLACFVFFRAIAARRSFDQPMGYVHRYLRLTPPYAAVILFEATIVNYMGNGPFWHRIHEQASQNCRDYWWSSLLYVQNYVNPLKLCLTQSWYLSSDMQMYWVSPFVLYPMYLWPALAVPYLGFLTLGVTFLDFAVVYINDLPANFALNPSNDRMTMDYYPFHTRMAPWLVGVALGYLIGGIKSKRITLKLSPLMTTCGWILSTVLMTASMQAMDYFNHNPDYTALECAFFLAFHRLGWAIGLAWIILACVNDFGGVVNKILSWTLFQPLAKLSFCSYLVHISVQRFRIGWLRTNVALEDVNTVWTFLGDFVASNLVAVIFFLLFEQPFAHIDKYLLTGKKIFPWPAPRPPRPKIAEEPKIDKSETAAEVKEQDKEPLNSQTRVSLQPDEIKVSDDHVVEMNPEHRLLRQVPSIEVNEVEDRTADTKEEVEVHNEAANGEIQTDIPKSVDSIAEATDDEKSEETSDKLNSKLQVIVEDEVSEKEDLISGEGN